MEPEQHVREEGGICMERAENELMKYIYEVSFALNDITLYLDTHPCDKEALEYYHKYKKQRHEAVREYEKCYGPLLNYDVNCDERWTWVDGPWPWEGV